MNLTKHLLLGSLPVILCVACATEETTNTASESLTAETAAPAAQQAQPAQPAGPQGQGQRPRRQGQGGQGGAAAGGFGGGMGGFGGGAPQGGFGGGMGGFGGGQGGAPAGGFGGGMGGFGGGQGGAPAGGFGGGMGGFGGGQGGAPAGGFGGGQAGFPAFGGGQGGAPAGGMPNFGGMGGFGGGAPAGGAPAPAAAGAQGGFPGFGGAAAGAAAGQQGGAAGAAAGQGQRPRRQGQGGQGGAAGQGGQRPAGMGQGFGGGQGGQRPAGMGQGFGGQGGQRPAGMGQGQGQRPAGMGQGQGQGQQRQQGAPGNGTITETKGTLRDAAKGLFEMGVALPTRVLNNPEGSALAAKHFNRVVAENEMKFESIERTEGVFNFSAGDQLVEFAQKNGMTVHGHTLVWHAQTPGWVFQDPNGGRASKELVLKRMKNHIDKVLEHYKGKVQTWDVVNEAFDDQGNLHNHSQWRTAIGDDYLRYAFEYAKAADPNAVLIYNDFSMANAPKRKGAIKYINEVINKDKKLCDGIGYQAHWDLNWPSLQQIQEAIDDARKAGLKLYFSELDINTDRSKRNSGRGLEVNTEVDPNSLQPITDMDAVLRERYVEIFNIFVKNTDVVKAVTVWGLSDDVSWIRGEPLLFKRYGGKLGPKPAVQALIDLMEKAKADKK